MPLVEKTSIRILLADNQPLTFAGIESFLSERDDLQIVGSITTADELPDVIKQCRPDVLITDYNTTGFISIEDLENTMKQYPGINVVIVSADNHRESILQVLGLGVKGYLTKECSKEEIWLAIQSAGKGEKFFCHKILDIIMDQRFSRSSDGACDPTILTRRETEILRLIAKGRSTRQIADNLHLSPHTVQTHRKSIIRKLNIKSPTEFVIYAMNLGIIPVSGKI